MAKELMRTPVVEVQWCKLLGEARPNKFEPSKPPTWEIEIILDNDNPEHMAWCEEIEGKFEELLPGERKSANWLPIKPDKEQPRKRQSCRMKLKQFTFKDGSLWPEKQLIGNGSKMRIGFEIYAWKGPSGAGLSLQPRAAQVVEWIAAPDTVSRTTATDFGFASSKEADAAVKAAAEAKDEPAPVTVTEASDGIPF
jgi:hypothetical protein